MKNMMIYSLLFSFLTMQMPHLALAADSNLSSNQNPTLQFVLDEQKAAASAQTQLEFLKQSLQTAVKNGNEYELSVRVDKSLQKAALISLAGSLFIGIFTKGTVRANAITKGILVFSGITLASSSFLKYEDQIDFLLSESEIEKLNQLIPLAEADLKNRRAALENLKQNLDSASSSVTP